MQAEDPYEFVGLLRNQPLVGTQRNAAIGRLTRTLAVNDTLRSALERLLAEFAGSIDWPAFRDALIHNADGGEEFARGFDDLSDGSSPARTIDRSNFT